MTREWKDVRQLKATEQQFSIFFNTNRKNWKKALQNRLFFPFTSEGEQTPIEGCNQSKNFYIKGGYFSPISEEISRGIFHLDFSEKF